MIGTVKRYRFTVDQYHRMGKARIFQPDCRVELVNGEIFEMSPIDPWHAGVVNWLTHRFITGLGGRAIVPVQNPTTVDPRSEPQSDLMLVKPRDDFYRTAHPTPEDALLVIEVANTSLPHDRRRKLPLYARTGVAEVWIVNRRADAVDIFRDPSPAGYRDQLRRGRGEHVAPSAFPDLRLSVDDILGPPIVNG
jgi:Uma2 family endonuclease